MKEIVFNYFLVIGQLFFVNVNVYIFIFFLVYLIQFFVCIFDVYLEGYDNFIVVRYSYVEVSNLFVVFYLYFNKMFFWVRIIINCIK